MFYEKVNNKTCSFSQAVSVAGAPPPVVDVAEAEVYHGRYDRSRTTTPLALGGGMIAYIFVMTTTAKAGGRGSCSREVRTPLLVDRVDESGALIVSCQFTFKFLSPIRQILK